MKGLRIALMIWVGVSGWCWGAEPVVVERGAEARQPQVAVGNGGMVAVVFGEGNGVKCAVSVDGGRTFGKAETVGSLPTMALGMRRGPRVAVADGVIVVAAVGGEQGGGKDGDVMAWRSEDQGKTWSGPQRINSVEGSAREGLHALAARPDGTVFAAWLDLRDGAMEVFGATSRDGGKTWGEDRLVYRSPERAICPCCHPSAAFGADGTLFVMLRNDVGGAKDMYLVRSKDAGETFSKGEKLGTKTWILKQCPMDGGAVAVTPDSRPVTIWRRGEEVFLESPDETGRERGLGPGVQPWAAAGPEGTVSVWLQRRPGRLMMVRPGARRPEVLAEEANDPVVASAPGARGPVVAAWERYEGGTRAGIAVELVEAARDERK